MQRPKCPVDRYYTPHYGNQELAKRFNNAVSSHHPPSPDCGINSSGMARPGPPPSAILDFALPSPKVDVRVDRDREGFE